MWFLKDVTPPCRVTCRRMGLPTESVTCIIGIETVQCECSQASQAYWDAAASTSCRVADSRVVTLGTSRWRSMWQPTTFAPLLLLTRLGTAWMWARYGTDTSSTCLHHDATPPPLHSSLPSVLLVSPSLHLSLQCFLPRAADQLRPRRFVVYPLHGWSSFVRHRSLD